jgi:hypothetical protein
MLRAIKDADIETIEELAEKITALESQADSVRRRIEEILFSGAFLPIIRGRILDLARRLDEVIDAAEDSSKIISILVKKEVPPKILAELITLGKKGKTATEFLKKTIFSFSEDEETIKEYFSNVRETEHNADEIKNKIYAAVYELNNLSAVKVMIITGLTDSLSNICDCCERAIDVISLLLIIQTG